MMLHAMGGEGIWAVVTIAPYNAYSVIRHCIYRCKHAFEFVTCHIICTLFTSLSLLRIACDGYS